MSLKRTTPSLLKELDLSFQYVWYGWYISDCIGITMAHGQTNIKPMNNHMSEISAFFFSQANHLLPPVKTIGIIGPLMVRQVYQQIRGALQRGYRSLASVAFDVR